MIRRSVSLFLLLAFTPFLAPDAGAGTRKMPEFRIPSEVRKTLHLPEVASSFAAVVPKDPFRVEVAVVPRQGLYRYYLNGRVQLLEKTWQTLFCFAEIQRDLSLPMKPATLPIVIYADRAVGWGAVERGLIAMADPDVRFHRIYYAVRTPDGDAALPLFLPGYGKPKGARAGSPSKSRAFSVFLMPDPKGAGVRVDLEGRSLGSGDTARAKLAKEIAPLFASRGFARVSIAAAPQVPYEDVIQTAVTLRKAGAASIVFRASPWPAVYPLPPSVRSKVHLPAARTAVAVKEKSPAFDVAVLPPSDGKQAPYYADETHLSVGNLKGRLSRIAARNVHFEGMRDVSTIPVLVFAAGRTRWKEARVVLKACADAYTPLSRVSFAVQDGKTVKALPVWLPVRAPGTGVGFLTLHLKPGEKGIEVKLKDEVLGVGEEGFKVFAAALAYVRKHYAKREFWGEIAADPDTPFRDVVRAVDEFRAAKVTQIRFVR